MASGMAGAGLRAPAACRVASDVLVVPEKDTPRVAAGGGPGGVGDGGGEGSGEPITDVVSGGGEGGGDPAGLISTAGLEPRRLLLRSDESIGEKDDGMGVASAASSSTRWPCRACDSASCFRVSSSSSFSIAFRLPAHLHVRRKSKAEKRRTNRGHC